MVEPALGAAVLLLAAADSVGDADSTVDSVTVEDPVAVLDSVDSTVVVITLEVRVTTTDVVVLVSVARDAVSPKIAVKLAVAAETSDLADESSEAILELAFKTTAPADSVAAAAAELARATRLLASDAASDILLAASDLASPRTLRISDALAEMAADTEAALVKISVWAFLAAEAGIFSAAEAAEATCETTELTETLISDRVLNSSSADCMTWRFAEKTSFSLT